MLVTRVLQLAALVFAALLMPACSSDDPHDDPPPTCGPIIEACHDKDKAPGAIHDCHVMAEQKHATECARQSAACLAVCKRGE